MRSRRATLLHRPSTAGFDTPFTSFRTTQPSAQELIDLSFSLTCLDTPQTGIDAAFGDEVVVFALFLELTAFEDKDAVGVADGAEAVGDDDGGAPDDDLFERALDEGFGLVVDGGGGFVEDQDGWVF